jgi:hypothetical protein
LSYIVEKTGFVRTTGTAAAEHERPFYAIRMRWIEVIIRRYSRLGGKMSARCQEGGEC